MSIHVAPRKNIRIDRLPKTDRKNVVAGRNCSEMAQNTSYPSPNSAQVGQGPFYASQHQLPVGEDVQTPAPQPHHPPPTSAERDVESGETNDRAQAVRSTPDLRHLQIASPIQLAQGGLESAQHYDPNDSASRKRTKVSRACDECRRKKVRDILILGLG